MNRELKKALSAHGWVVARQFKKLDDEARAEVERLFMRHLAACNASGIKIDPHFLPEAINDLKRYGAELYV